MSPKARRGRLIPAFIACFYAGVAVGWWVHATVGPGDERTNIAEATPEATSGEVPRRSPAFKPAKPEPADTPADATVAAEATVANEPANPSSDVPGMGVDVLAELRRRDLRVPVEGAEIDDMEGDFAERRGGGSRGHEAVDIIAPRNTPIHAVDHGSIARLFFSKAGGITIYQFDSARRYCYYYAHLERYAPGLEDGMAVRKGDVIGYVGTSGNAPPGTPHLHFAIFELTDPRRWWEGRPIDPYLVYR